MYNSRARFIVNPAGRRSYKTELRKRKLLLGDKYHKGALQQRGNYFFAAPTRDQAKRIAWNDLKMMSRPHWCRLPSETELIIYLLGGSTLHVIGMDKPQRIEGSQWHGGVLDEFADMKREAFFENVRPALSDTNGWCDLIGVPGGLNHFYELFLYAKNENDPEWGSFSWRSADMIAESEIEAAKKQLDIKTFRQEYEAAFENAAGRAAYNFSRGKNVLKLQPSCNLPLYLSFDFNVDPMTTSIAQIAEGTKPAHQEKIINVLEAVHSPDCNSQVQCDIIRQRIHQIPYNGKLFITGDATNQRRTESNYTNWEIIRSNFPKASIDVSSSNPAVIDRINALNAKMQNAEGKTGIFINSEGCTELIKDLEQTTWAEGRRELDKSDRARTHHIDNLSYLVHEYFPLTGTPIITWRRL
jgi:hypothetical protein